MKYYNKKIADFVNWCEENDWPLYTPKLFRLYRMENPEVEELEDDEENYLKLLYETKTQKLWAIGSIKQDSAKLTLMNDCGWSEKSKIEQTQNVEYVKLDSTGMLNYNTSANNHNNESLENEAIADLKLNN